MKFICNCNTLIDKCNQFPIAFEYKDWETFLSFEGLPIKTTTRIICEVSSYYQEVLQPKLLTVAMLLDVRTR